VCCAKESLGRGRLVWDREGWGGLGPPLRGGGREVPKSEEGGADTPPPTTLAAWTPSHRSLGERAATDRGQRGSGPWSSGTELLRRCPERLGLEIFKSENVTQVGTIQLCIRCKCTAGEFMSDADYTGIQSSSPSKLPQSL